MSIIHGARAAAHVAPPLRDAGGARLLRVTVVLKDLSDEVLAKYAAAVGTKFRHLAQGEDKGSG